MKKLLLITMTPLLIALPAAAQGPALFRLRPLDGAVRLRFEGERERFGPTAERAEFEEELTLSTGGFIVDPRLLEFQTSGTFGLFQERGSGAAAEESTDGTLWGFGLGVTSFKTRPYTFLLSAARTEDRTDREFGGSSTVRRENYEGAVLLKELPLRSTLRARYEETDEEIRFPDLITRREEIRRTLLYEGRREGPRSFLTLAYEHTDLDDLVVPVRSAVTDRARANHRFRFGAGRQHSLASSASFSSRRNVSDRLDFSLAENLSLIHGETLASSYNYSFSSFDSDGEEIRTHSGGASLHHQLYESLGTTLGVSGSSSDLTEGQQSTYGGNFGLAYTKSVHAQGRLRAGYDVSYGITDSDIPEGERAVFDERLVLAGLFFVALANPRVIPGTVVVTDETGVTIYLEGVDYVVRITGTITELQRVPTGGIADGQAVLVDYRFRTAPALRHSTLGQRWGMSVDYPRFTLFYHHIRQDQTLLEGLEENAEFLEDIREDQVGGELRWDWPQGGVRGRGEYTRHTSTTLAFDAVEFTESATYRPTFNFSGTLDLNQSFRDDRRVDRQTTVYGGRLGIHWWPPLVDTLSAFLAARHREQTDAPEQNDYEAGVQVRRRFRALEFSGSYRYSLQEVEKESRDLHRITLEVIRRF